ncbi:hypothetical protein OJAV_G00208710 [Oryzias javanicus]|uniref:ADP-ribosylation factor-like protein 5A n=1 Tax=Oryzias javanicus TaxID=123683 RepID=A0A437C705_ORYJA|nr:hypothetical protein OJAV_G00208710 [Oryzias javanicus]
MGILFTKLWRLFNHQEHKVIIVGLDNAGKTTILYQFSMNEVVHTSPTIGSNVEEIVVNNTHFLMWDIGGQESLRSSWNTYYTNTEFVIVVVDSTDRERISVTKEELYRMLAHEDLRKAGPPVAHPGLLRPHRGRALPGSGVDDVTAAREMMSLTTLSFSASPFEDWRKDI